MFRLRPDLNGTEPALSDVHGSHGNTTTTKAVAEATSVIQCSSFRQSACAVNRLLVDAGIRESLGSQNQYFSQPRDSEKTKQYAQKFISDEGKQNGLYWPVSAGQAPSPFEDVRDFAKAAGYTKAGDKPQPFNGYYYRILTKQGDKAKGGAKVYLVNGRMTVGFAVVAYPAEYRNSGIMTFIVAKDGVVYQKDLGERSVEIAQAATEYDPGDGWKPAL